MIRTDRITADSALDVGDVTLHNPDGDCTISIYHSSNNNTTRISGNTIQFDPGLNIIDADGTYLVRDGRKEETPQTGDGEEDNTTEGSATLDSLDTLIVGRSHDEYHLEWAVTGNQGILIDSDLIPIPYDTPAVILGNLEADGVNVKLHNEQTGFDANIGLLGVFADSEVAPKASLFIDGNDPRVTSQLVGVLLTNFAKIKTRDNNANLITLACRPGASLDFGGDDAGFYIGQNLHLATPHPRCYSPIILDVGDPAASHDPTLYLPTPSWEHSNQPALVLKGTIKLDEACNIIDKNGILIVEGGEIVKNSYPYY